MVKLFREALVDMPLVTVREGRITPNPGPSEP